MRTILLVLALAASAAGANPPNLNEWTAMSPGGWGPGVDIVGYESTVYVGSRKLHCTLNFYKMVSTEPNSAMVCLSYAENAWHVLSKGENFISAHMSGGGHTAGQIAWMSDKDAIIYESDSSGGLTSQSILGHMSWFDVAGLTTRDKETVGRPWFDAGTPYGSASYNPTNGKLVIWWVYNGSYTTGILDTATNVITTPTTTGTPPTGATFNINFVYNPVDHKHYLYGGGQADVYTFDDATNDWQKLTTTCVGAACVGAATPPARVAAGFAYSTVDHKFLMMGGCAGASLCSTALTDTWLFDPVTRQWAQQTPTGSYPNDPVNPSFMRLTYDEDSNVFVYVTYARGAYAYAISTPLAYGRNSMTTATVATSLNRTPASSSDGAWAIDPAIAISGTDIYLGHHETGDKASSDGCAFLHPYITSTPNTGTFTNLPTGTKGAACLAIDPLVGGQNGDSSKLQLAVVNGTLWEAHERFNTSSTLSPRAWAKYWNGTAWVGGEIGAITGTYGTTSITQYPQALIANGTTPTLGFIEWDNGFSSFIRSGWAYVKEWNGSSWVQKGTGKLNIDTGDGSRALFLAMATDGTNPAACWVEEKNSDRRTLSTTPQVQCKQWNGSAWVRWGTSSLNQGGAASYATGVAMTYVNGKFYVSWTEKPTVSGVQKLYLCRWDGTGCTLLGGGALNINTTTGIAYHPSLTTDGTNVFLAWEEQSAPGQKPLGYVKQLTVSSGTVSQLGGAIASDATNGSVEGITLAASYSVRPTAVWTELEYGALRQVYTKQWTGSTWADIGLVTAAPTITTTSLPAGNVGTAYSQTLAATGNPSSFTWSLASGSLPTGMSLSSDGVISGTPTAVGTASFVVQVTNGVSPDDTKALSIAIGCPTSPSFITSTTAIVSQSSTPTRPAVGGFVSDPTYGNCLQRVTDGSDPTYTQHNPNHAYAKLQAWNSNGTKLLVNGVTGSGFQVLDATTFATVRSVGTGTLDVRWNPTDPDMLYYLSNNQFVKYVVSTGVATVLRTFTEYTELEYSGYTFEEISRDGRWVAITGVVSGVPQDIFVYDITNNVKGAVVPWGPAFDPVNAVCGYAGPSWAGMSPTGAYLVIQWPTGSTGRYCGIETYNRTTGAYIGKVVEDTMQHEDMIVDSSGVEWVVQFDSNSPRLRKERIPSGADDVKAGDATGIQVLVDLVWGNNGHVSCRSNQDFCLVSSYNDLNAGGSTDDQNGASRPFENELFTVALNSTPSVPVVKRIAYTRSWAGWSTVNCPGTWNPNYWAEPRASLNHDGTKAIFSTTWGANCPTDDWLVSIPVAVSSTNGGAKRGGRLTLGGRVNH